MTRREIPFNDWTPDKAEYQSNLVEAKNVIPVDGYYRPCGDTTRVATTAFPEEVLHGVSFKDDSEEVKVYAGTASKLYTISGGSYVERGSGYTTGTGETWEFITYGAKILATNFSDYIQVADIGSGNFADLQSGNASASDDAPKAKHLAVINQFIVAGNLQDYRGRSADGLRWSALDDIDDWTADSVTLSDIQELHGGDGEAITKVVGGEQVGYIFQRSRITRMIFVGSPLIFRFEEVQGAVGTDISGSIISNTKNIFFINDEGIQQFAGGQLLNIGVAKVNSWFKKRFDARKKNRVRSVVSLGDGIIMWSFSSKEAGDYNDSLLFYNYLTNQFSYAELVVTSLFEGFTSGITIDDLDNYFATIDDVNLNFNDPFLRGGVATIYATDSSNYLATLTGSPLETQFVTGKIQLFGRNRAELEDLELGLDSTNYSIKINSLENLGAVDNYSISRNPDSLGLVRTNEAGRYHQFQIDITGDYKLATGLVVHGHDLGEV